MMSLFSFDFSAAELSILLLVAVCIGMSKTGVHGAGMIAVPLLASVFGGRLSSGIMLPILCLADVMGVWYYHRHASWEHLRKLFPWAALGTIVGTMAGGTIDDELFKVLMAAIIICSLAIMIWLERARQEQVPHHYWFAAMTGIAGGFSSMIGNLAGSVMAVYLLSMRLPKNSFIGTSAWFFLVINWFKVPLHVWVWKTITWNVFFLDMMLIPPIALGAFLGVLIVRNLREHVYRWFIIGMTLIAAVFMFL